MEELNKVLNVIIPPIAHIIAAMILIFNANNTTWNTWLIWFMYLAVYHSVNELPEMLKENNEKHISSN